MTLPTTNEELYDDIFVINRNNFLEIVSSDEQFYNFKAYVEININNCVDRNSEIINFTFSKINDEPNIALEELFHNSLNKSKESEKYDPRNVVSLEIQKNNDQQTKENSLVIHKGSISLNDIKKPNEKDLILTKKLISTGTPPSASSSENTYHEIQNLISLINFEKISPLQNIRNFNLNKFDKTFLIEKYGKLSSMIIQYLSDVHIPVKDIYEIKKEEIVESTKQLFYTGSILKTNIPKNNKLKIDISLLNTKNMVLQKEPSFEFDISNLLLSHETNDETPELKIIKKSTNNYILYVSNISKKSSYDIHKIDLSKHGEISNEKHIGDISADKNYFNVLLENNLSLIRVYPKLHTNSRSLNFSEIVVGEGFSSIGLVSLIPYQNETDCIFLKLSGIPEGTYSLDVFRRKLEKNDSEYYSEPDFDLIFSHHIDNFTKSQIVIKDCSVIESHYYEYYVRCNFFDRQTNEPKQEYTKQKLIKSRSINNDQQITVNIKNLKTNGSNIEFDIVTTIDQKENEKLTEYIKKDLEEIYKQFMDANVNEDSVIDITGQTYGFLIFHEVIRHNLTTGESENFGIIKGRKFYDNIDQSIAKNIKALNYKNNYEYQILTYKKDPFELFKKFVKSGDYDLEGEDFKKISSNNKKWFYSPYKWKNVSSYNGVLYPQNENTNEVVISEYEKLTTDFCGTLNINKYLSENLESSSISLKLNQIDRDTIKLYIDGNLANIDYFIVCISINNKRKILGTTKQNYYFYDLKKEDYGEVTFFVLPVNLNLSIANVKVSNTLIISSI